MNRKKTLTALIAVRVSPQEKAALERKAAQAGLPLGTWIRLKMRLWLRR
jgi:predicted HicB family RNase H-like nuclease